MTETDAAVTAARHRRAGRDSALEQNKLVRELHTPEGAILKLNIASAGERAGAFIIDFIIIILTLIIAIFTFAYIASGLGFRGNYIAYAITAVFLFLLRNFYFVFFEIGRRAATPGKRLLGLRVAARNGGRLTASAVFARNFTREVEAFLPITLIVFSGAQSGVEGWLVLMAVIWSGIFLFLPLFNSDKLRAGDVIAGTWVIRNPKVVLLGDIGGKTTSKKAQAERDGFNFNTVQVSAYGIHELHALEKVLRESSPETKSSVADLIRTKIDWTRGPGEKDIAFLEAYYSALRRHLEQKLLLGKRKEDKFDKN